MIALAALLLQAAAATPPALEAWPDLPELRLRDPIRSTPELSEFVRLEVVDGRCALPAEDPSLTLEMAVFIHRDGTIRRIVPHAIGCPTVEQYAAGLLTRLARSNLASGTLGSEAWYRFTMRFAWKG